MSMPRAWALGSGIKTLNLLLISAIGIQPVRNFVTNFDETEPLTAGYLFVATLCAK